MFRRSREGGTTESHPQAAHGELVKLVEAVATASSTVRSATTTEAGRPSVNESTLPAGITRSGPRRITVQSPAATGYSILKADSLNAATDLAKGCPVLLSGGKITVYEITPAM